MTTTTGNEADDKWDAETISDRSTNKTKHNDLPQMLRELVTMSSTDPQNNNDHQEDMENREYKPDTQPPPEETTAQVEW